MKRLLPLLLALLLALSLAGCGGGRSPLPDAPTPQITRTPEAVQSSAPTPGPAKTPAPQVIKDGSYYDLEHVILYLEAYGRLPGNYITKREAQALGWPGGSLEPYKKGAAIGGDRFGNYEKRLPAGGGVRYTECDIDTRGAKSRGAKRLVFSSTGRYYYTADHYDSFTEYIVKNGRVIKK